MPLPNRNRYLQLLADNRSVQGRRFEVRLQAEADAAEVLIYDAIVDDAQMAEWFGGVAAEPVVRALRDITASTIHLRVNSPGGSVFAARAIEQALREHPARVVAHIDGLAASAASFLVMASDEIVMPKGAMMMIHKAWSVAWGNDDDLMATAALLGKIDGTLVETYADRTGQPAQQILDWMRAETWFTGTEAVELGFADRLADGATRADESAQGQAAPGAWNLSAYLRAPHAAKPAQAPAPGSSGEALVSDEHRARQRQRLACMARVASTI